MAVEMHSCAMKSMKLKDDVHGDVMESNSSSESYASPDERKSKSGSSYESNSYSESGGSPDALKSKSGSSYESNSYCESGGSSDKLKSKFESSCVIDCNSGSEIIDEGFLELAAMDVCDEEYYDDDMILSPRAAKARKNNYLPEDRYPERCSDWWRSSDLNRNKEDDIIDPQVWEAAERLYSEQIQASNGFDVDDFKGQYCALGIIQPLPKFKEDSEFEIILQLSVLAIDKYNGENGTKYQFIEVEKVNSQLAADFVYYITFKAKQVADVDDETTFQAVGSSGMPSGELSVYYCRLKTTS